MNLFDWLIVSHLIGDFLFQSDGMARYKTQHWQWMLRHVGLYTVLIAVVLIAYGLYHDVPVWAVASALLFVFVTHLALDRRRLTAWWMRRVGMQPDHPWLPIVVDQVCHLLTLAVVAQGLSLVQR